SGNAYTPYDAFTLDDAAPDDGDGVSSTVTYNVDPGTYTITEILPNSLWNLSNATCTGASGTVSLTDETLSVAISNGEAVQCTFTNEVLCPASWIVTNENELAACIILANNNESPSPTADTITLGADITLTTALPHITSEILLEGPNHFIDGGDSVQLFYVNSAGNFTVNQVTLQNGSATNGGAIYNSGTLTVTDSTFIGNSASDSGGGIYNGTGMLIVTNSTFSGNAANYLGGGISNDNGGPLTVTNTTFSSNSANYGGGIYNNFGTLTVTNSTFSGNVVDDSGGGIYNNFGTLTVTNSTFSDNSANYGGGVYNNIGTAHLAGTILANSTSGGNCVSISTLNDNGYNLS
ncbi:MAG: hypothetical protein KC423_26875, partial [Anaerolineales bacterium]|nr:hypothetical protein [Anaerolineales bacterium]